MNGKGSEALLKERPDDFFTYDPNTTVNLSVQYKPSSNLMASVTVFDLLNEEFVAAGTYDGWYPSTPGMGQEFVFKLKYDF